MPEENINKRETVLEKLILVEKIKIGIEQANNGEMYSLEELKEEMKTC